MSRVRIVGACSMVLGLLDGCSVQSATDGAAVPPHEETGDARAAATFLRKDYVYSILPSAGYWGEWRQDIFCNPGMWAIGYKLRVESPLGRDDDTALNSVQMLCATQDGSSSEWITSHAGFWGDWGNASSCTGAANLLTSVRMRVEAPLGSGDDTAANDVEFGCKNGGSIHVTNGNRWGAWSDWAYCPVGSAACGMSIRLESRLGDGDDTAMNGMRVHCCQM